MPTFGGGDPIDLASQLSEYESGLLNDEETDALFQHLVDTGLAWELQGSYGRDAVYFIQQGRVNPPTSRPTLYHNPGGIVIEI